MTFGERGASSSSPVRRREPFDEAGDALCLARRIETLHVSGNLEEFRDGDEEVVEGARRNVLGDRLAAGIVAVHPAARRAIGEGPVEQDGQGFVDAMAKAGRAGAIHGEECLQGFGLRPAA